MQAEISRKVFFEALDKIGGDLSDAEKDGIMVEIDKNHDGTISEAELGKFITKHMGAPH